jgi:predicted HTH domain antitoxin
MSVVHLDAEITALLHTSNQTLQQTAQELIVLELYRRGTLASGKAANLLNMSRFDFIHHASRLGIPFFEMTQDEWEVERQLVERL